jgi:hypothetical protein
MDAAFGDDVVDISGPFFRFSLYFSLLFRIRLEGDGFSNQDCLWRRVVDEMPNFCLLRKVPPEGIAISFCLIPPPLRASWPVHPRSSF